MLILNLFSSLRLSPNLLSSICSLSFLFRRRHSTPSIAQAQQCCFAAQFPVTASSFPRRFDAASSRSPMSWRLRSFLEPSSILAHLLRSLYVSLSHSRALSLSPLPKTQIIEQQNHQNHQNNGNSELVSFTVLMIFKEYVSNSMGGKHKLFCL